ncbi:MAG: hypothetical protein EOP51_04865 [Sphingobacteriales bacterium]|nr:MAG: hypothetical protein EOP51_04865 [Sphingobacteriales bacterium]
MKQNQKNIFLAIILIAFVAIIRIASREFHLFNIAPIGALALFSGAIIKDKRISLATPLIAMILGDLFFQFFTSIPGFYGAEQWFVYGAVALVTIMGTFMGKATPVKVAGFTLGGSFLFFVISNFGSFLSGMWGTGFKGLVTTYTMALPFYEKTIAGDLIGSLVFFGAYFLAQRATVKSAQQA